MPDQRKRTNVEIDVLNQFLKEGETPLPYEVDVTPAPNTETIPLTPEQQKVQDEQILAEQQQKELEEKEAAAKQKVIDDAAEAEKNKIIAQEAEKNRLATPENTTAPAFELDDEKVLAYIKYKKGKEFTSLDEFLNPKQPLTEDEKRAAAEQRDANKIAYGLSKGLFTKKQLEDFITDTTNPTDLVYNLYVQQQKEIDPELKDEEIKEDFNEKFGINAKKESKEYIVGQNLLNNLADNVIRKKHSVILNLDNEFTSHETAQLQQKETEAKVLKAAPLYKKDVEEVRSEIKKISIALDENTTFDTIIDDEIVNDIVENMLDKKYSEHQISSGWNKETIRQVAQTSAIIKSLPKILTEYANEQILAKQAGVRGIPPAGKQGARDGSVPELTERQKVMQQHFFKEEAIAN